MSHPVEEEYQDVLQNLESAVLAVSRQHSGMPDYFISDAYEALITNYAAETNERIPPKLRINGLALEVFHGIKNVCEWRLGRSTFEAAEKQGGTTVETPISLEILVKCLKRLHKSQKYWTQEGGRQGYQNYISQFIR
ncbi:MAG: hypothetical protein H9535_22085 [Ignavibacteria bacterium]|nr:hypothetical protein [Ignavibacteria bacterium]